MTPTTEAGRRIVDYLTGPVDCDEHDTPEWRPRWEAEIAAIEAEARKQAVAAERKRLRGEVKAHFGIGPMGGYPSDDLAWLLALLADPAEPETGDGA